MNKDLIKVATRLVSSRGVPLRNSSPRKSPVVGKRRRDVVLFSALKISKQPSNKPSPALSPLLLGGEGKGREGKGRGEREVVLQTPTAHRVNRPPHPSTHSNSEGCALSSRRRHPARPSVHERAEQSRLHRRPYHRRPHHRAKVHVVRTDRTHVVFD